MIPLALALADLTLAAPLPESSIGASLGAGAAPIGAWPGIALSTGLSSGLLLLELDGRGGPALGTARASALIRARVAARQHTSRALDLGPIAGVGLQLGALPRPAASIGLSGETGRGEILRPRFDLEYVWQPDIPWQLLATLSLSVHRPHSPLAKPTADASSLALPTAQAMVWLPAPVCSWLTPDRASEAASAIGARQSAISILDARTVRDPTQDPLAPEPPPEGGTLVVAAWPGDRVDVDGQPLPLEGDGVGTALFPEGERAIIVTGSGRRQTLTIALPIDSTLWVAVDRPPSQTILFDAASSRLSEEALATIREIATFAGDSRLSIAGGHSIEGSPDRNRALANERAEAVLGALIAAGLPADRLSIAPALPLDPLLPPERQRVVHITPEIP